DLITLKFIGDFSSRPNYIFGGFGLLNLALGLLAFVVVGYRVLFLRHLEATPLVFLMVLFSITGTLSLFIGFLADIIIRGFYDPQRKPTYYVRDTVGVDRYEERGISSLGDLEGMFAIALWDAPARTLVLARDRLGIKPLYYALLADQIVFASELKALVDHPAVDRTLDLTALSRYLAHEYVPAPASIFRSIRKLPAGHWLTYTEGRVKIEPYWSLPFRPDRTLGDADAVEMLRGALDLAVRQHLVSDVP